jgi:hypothetical protein
MIELENYMKDGANWQARAVLCALQGVYSIEESWSDDQKQYLAQPKVARWENCREQGYVVCMRSQDYSKQINIAFFEHRNSDSICAVKWEQNTINSPTIGTAEFGNVYKDKYDVSFEVRFGQFMEMADWIQEQLEQFWLSTKTVDPSKTF